MNSLHIEFFDEAFDFIDKLPDNDKAKVMAHIKIMETDYTVVYTKVVKNPIRELIVKRYRFLFFIHKSTIYVLSGFIKKTQKTPLQEIRKAEALYKAFI